MVEEKAVRMWYIKEKRQFTFEYQFSIFLASKTGTDSNFAGFFSPLSHGVCDAQLFWNNKMQ